MRVRIESIALDSLGREYMIRVEDPDYPKGIWQGAGLEQMARIAFNHAEALRMSIPRTVALLPVSEDHRGHGCAQDPDVRAEHGEGDAPPAPPSIPLDDLPPDQRPQ